MDISRYNMTNDDIAELAEAFARGQKAFITDPNPFNDAFFTWDAFEEGRVASIYAANPYSLVLARDLQLV